MKQQNYEAQQRQLFARRNTMARIPSFDQGNTLPDYIIHSQKYKDIQEMN